MHPLIFVSLTCLIYFIQITSFVNTESGMNYGDYIPRVESVIVCKGIKKQNVSDIFIKYMVYDNDTGLLNGNITVFQDVGPVMAKVRIMKWSVANNRFETLITHKSDSACEFTMLRTKVFEYFVAFAAADQRCIVKKGTVNIVDLNTGDLTLSLMGEKFFYGRYRITFNFFTVKKNVICMDAVTQIKRKPNKIA